MSEESLIASRVYGRKLEKPPITWPAFAVAAVLGAALTMAYSIGFLGLTDGPLNLSRLIDSRFLFSIVPCALISLGLWTLLYFGFVRWRNATMGPIYFNALAGIVFATSLLSPLAIHGVRYVEHQIDLHKARQAWATVPALKTELAAIAARDRAGDAADLAVLGPKMKATDKALVISAVTIASPADVRAMSGRIADTLKAMDAAEAADAGRWRQTRAAIDAAMKRANPPPLVRDHVRARLDDDTKIAFNRHVAEDDLRRATYKEFQAALDVFTRANGLWRSDGDNLMFARTSDIEAIETHLNRGERLRRRLYDIPTEPLPSQSWSRPPAGVDKIRE